MGAGASIQTADPRIDGEASNRRLASSRMANSSRTAKSVRAMALMNHSRHENSYINADSISVHLAGKNRAQAKAEIEYPPDYKHQDAKGDNTASNLNVITAIAESPNENPSEKAPPVVPQPAGGGMSMFRSQFGLKLQLDDDADWGHVS